MNEPAYGPTGPGAVALDIGGEIGTLILYTPAELLGAEIEISPRAPAAKRTHAAVRERHTPNRTCYAALYPGLPAGEYTIWQDHGKPLATITITGGQITHHKWPSRLP